MVVTHFKHFSDIGFLRRLNLDLLLAFLRQYEEYLTHRRSLALDGNLLTFPYQHLAEILLTPDSDIPMEMVEGLYLVHELPRKASMETLCRHLENAKKLPTDHLPLEDLLLLTLIEKRDILDYVHAEQYLVRPKKFETVFCRSGHAPTIISEDLTPLENDLGEWFSMQRKGRGAKVYRFIRPDGIVRTSCCSSSTVPCFGVPYARLSKSGPASRRCRNS